MPERRAGQTVGRPAELSWRVHSVLAFLKHVVKYRGLLIINDALVRENFRLYFLCSCACALASGILGLYLANFSRVRVGANYCSQLSGRQTD